MFDFSPYIQVIIPVAFLMSFIFSFITIPSIVKISKKHNLLVYPNHRDSHNGGVPRLGGLAIFISVVFSLIFFSGINTLVYFRSILTAVIVLFFIGLHDDLDSLGAWKKLTWEAMASLLVIFGGQMYFSNLYGFLGIQQLGYIPAVIISVVTFVSIINAFNLVDGIDGLASGLCIQISVIFGIHFFIEGAYKFTILAAIVTGAVLAFFYFNVWSKKYKLFMGDSGSLVLGLLIGLMVWRFCELNLQPNLIFRVYAAPAVAMGILAVPLFDTLRVLILRISKKKSPFLADRSHIHHILLDLGMSHSGVRASLLSFNLAMTLLAYALQTVIHSVILIILILLATCLVSLYLVRKRLPMAEKN